ncbi:MAG: triose-phosphate isomerase [Deltaproteobacteria bacterium]|nr:triose-phosphate isomerase [Deltaproteobacteria bacterium]
MSIRMPLMAGNWKMHYTAAEAVALVEELKQGITRFHDREVVVAPTFTALPAVANALSGSPIRLAAQNCHWEKQGAYTGEISPPMLKDVGCHYVIIGHSERRQYFRETDQEVNLKAAALLAQGGKTLDVLAEQLGGGLSGLEAPPADRIVIAYEPIWAIGTGLTATTEQAQEAHAFIRERLVKWCNKTVANQIRILYGGSVKPDNVDALMAMPDIDGVLVGGASLKGPSFIRIVEFQE